MEPVVGEISAFRGAVTVNGQPAVAGMKIQQGVRVETGANAFVTIQLPDASAISLPSQSRIYIARLRHILLGGVERNFVLEAGRSRSTVTPFKDPASNFHVTTPLSVSAVRGTDFRVSLDPSGGRAATEVVNGAVGVAADAGRPETLVQKNFGITATPDGLGTVTALLPPPMLVNVEKTPTGAVIVAKPVDGAKSYRIQLATDVVFHDVFDESLSDKPTANFTISASTAFFIRLTAIDGTGLEGLPGTYALGRATPLEASSGEARVRTRDGN